MNEKIKELIKQSGIKLDLDPDSNCYEAQVDDDDMEYFAELIVKECQVALKPMLRDMISRGHAYDLIKEYFGVEE